MTDHSIPISISFRDKDSTGFPTFWFNYDKDEYYVLGTEALDICIETDEEHPCSAFIALKNCANYPYQEEKMTDIRGPLTTFATLYGTRSKRLTRPYVEIRIFVYGLKRTFKAQIIWDRNFLAKQSPLNKIYVKYLDATMPTSSERKALVQLGNYESSFACSRQPLWNHTRWFALPQFDGHCVYYKMLPETNFVAVPYPSLSMVRPELIDRDQH
jgi:hypothetical protein